MKRSKIVLSISSGLLAIVGIAATKAHRTTDVTAYYSVSGICSSSQSVLVPCVYTTNARDPQCTTVINAVTKPLYTKVTGSTCGAAFHYNNGEE